MPSPPDLGERRSAFRSLHQGGCFVMPNPWDAGTAKALAAAGFPALATTSAGFAFSGGLPDAPDSLALEPVIAHVAEIVAATELPVNADFQAGYAADTGGLNENVRRCVKAGVAGLSIEDTRPDPGGGRPLFELAEAVERIAAARAAIDEARADVMLTGRAECFLVGHPDPLAEAIRRLSAYAEAGADVLFAPGVREPGQICAIVEAVAPKPVNVLVGAAIGLRVADLAELGVRRISVGSALSRVAWGAFRRAAEALAEEGSFAGLEGAAPFAELNALFGPA
jgi:2-methylisocitrate lyase-like PEP mutase family enzyme